MEQDDLRQEIAIAIWRALDRFRGDSAERTYVIRIARNRALTFSAQRARRRALLQTLSLEPSERAAEGSEAVVDDSIALALSALSSQDRSLLELVAAGFSPRQIAVKLGKSSGAIRIALHRARLSLRSLLGAREGDR